MGKNRKSKAMATHFARGNMNNNPPGNYNSHMSGTERFHQTMPTSSYQSGYQGSNYQSDYQEPTSQSDYQGSYQSFRQDAYHQSPGQRIDQSPTYNRSQRQQSNEKHFTGAQWNTSPSGNYSSEAYGSERTYRSTPTSTYQNTYQDTNQLYNQDTYQHSKQQEFDQGPKLRNANNRRGRGKGKQAYNNPTANYGSHEKNNPVGNYNFLENNNPMGNYSLNAASNSAGSNTEGSYSLTAGSNPTGSYSSCANYADGSYQNVSASSHQSNYQDTNEFYSQDSYKNSQQGFGQSQTVKTRKNRKRKQNQKSSLGGQANNNPTRNYGLHGNNISTGNSSLHANDSSTGNYSSFVNDTGLSNDNSYQGIDQSYSQDSYQNSQQGFGQSQTAKTRKNRKRKQKQKSSLGGQAHNNPTNYGLRGNNISTGNSSLHANDSSTGNYSSFVNDTGLSNDNSYQGIDQSYSQDSYQFSEQQGFYQSQDDVYSQYKSAQQKFDSGQVSHGSYEEYYDQPLNNDMYSITPQQQEPYPSTLSAGAPSTSSTPRSHRLGFGPYPQFQLESAKDSMKGVSKPQKTQRKRKMGQNANVGQSKAKAPKKMNYGPGSAGSAGTDNGGNAEVGGAGSTGFAATDATPAGVAGSAGRGTGSAGRGAGFAGRGAGRGKNKRKKAPAAAGKAGTAATDNRYAVASSIELDRNQSDNQGSSFAAGNTAQFQGNTENVIQRIADNLGVVLNQQRVQNIDQGNRFPSANTEAIIQTIADRIGSGMMQQEKQMEPFMDALPENLGLLLQSVCNDPDAMEQLEQELYQRGPAQKSKPQSLYKCEYCEFSSPVAQDAREHLKKENHYAVSHCKCEVSANGNIEVLEITQPMAMKNKLAYLKAVVVVCWECGMVFQDIYQCAWHTKTSHKYGKGAYCLSNVVAENTFLLEECQHCVDCNLVFRNKKEFQEHKKSDGSKSGGEGPMPSDCVDKKTFQIFSCMYCDQVFRSDTWSSGFSHLQGHKNHTRKSIAFHVSDFELPQQQVQVPPVRLNGQDGYYEFEKQLLVRLVTHLSKMCGEKKARKRVRDKLKNLRTFKTPNE